MPPKKKGNKKANDDWESELGETVDPVTAAAQQTKDTEATLDDEEEGDATGGGGLLAALKKNKSKKQKKGKPVEDDYVLGEDPPAQDGVNGHGASNVIEDIAAIASDKTTTEELYDAQVKKAKGGKGKQVKEEEKEVEDGDESVEEGGTLKSKKEKEKEKKEREKMRKREQVCAIRLG